MIDAVIFDFDGLILETELPYFQSLQEMYQSYNCTVPPQFFEAIGSNELFDPYQDLERQLGYAIDIDTIRAQCRKRHWALVEKQPVLPGVEACLAEAKQLGIKVGLASSSPCSWVIGHLSRLKLTGYFDCIRCSNDVAYTKPEPDLYLAVLSGIKIEAGRAIALEDSPNGITAAKRAGLWCVGIPSIMTRNLCFKQADLVIDSLASFTLTDLIPERQKGVKPKKKR